MDFVFPENENDTQNAYTISKSKPTNLHLARMPDNFKISMGTDQTPKEATKVNRNLIVKKQKLTETESKDTQQYVMEDLDDVKKGEESANHATRYIGTEVKHNQKYLVFYRKDKDIMLCNLSSIISFKKDQQLKSSAIETIKGKRGGRQQGIKALLRNTAKKDDEKEKDKDKNKDGEGKDKDEDEDGLSEKSWSDSDDSGSDTSGPKAKGRKKKEPAMAIKNIFEENAPEPPKAQKVTTAREKASVGGKATVEKEPSEKSAADAKDDDSSGSDFDFE